MPRAPFRLLLVPLVLACAGAPPLPPGATPVPALGDAFPLLETKLAHAQGAPADVEIRELRALAVDGEPWQPLALERAAAHPGRMAVIAGRSCHVREGLSRKGVEQGSWYVFETGRLVAFDHLGFDARCALRSAFEPVAPAQVGVERSLMRYVAQRWPPPEIAGTDRLARGLRLLAVGRGEDARYELHALDRRIAELERRQSEAETPDAEERAKLGQEEAALRPLRARLARALKEHANEERGQR